MDSKILDKFTIHLKNALKKANELANSLNHQLVNPEHLIYGLILQKGSIAAEILTKVGLNAERVRSLVVQSNKPVASENSQIKDRKVISSLPTKKTIEKAALIAHQNGHKYVGTEHLLYGLIQINTSTLIDLWESNRVNLNKLRSHLDTVMRLSLIHI